MGKDSKWLPNRALPGSSRVDVSHAHVTTYSHISPPGEMANSAPRQSSEGGASPLLISLCRHHLPRGSFCQHQPNSGPSGFFSHRTEISHPGSIPQLEASVICPGWACLFHPHPHTHPLLPPSTSTSITRALADVP